jgi:hypothetical protein
MKNSRKGREIRAAWVKVSVVFFLGWLATSFLSLKTQEISTIATSIPKSQRTQELSTVISSATTSWQSTTSSLLPALKLKTQPKLVNISSLTSKRTREVMSKVASSTPVSLQSIRETQEILKPLGENVSTESTDNVALTHKRHFDDIDHKPRTGFSNASQSHIPKAVIDSSMDCQKSAEGIVIVVTRSVVAPPRRPARLSAIAKTWAPEVKARGGEVIVLVAKDPDAECGTSVLHTETTALPFSCVAPPHPLDLSTDKAKVFEWIVKALLLRDNGFSEDGGRDNESFSLLRHDDGGHPHLKYVLWCNDHTFVVPGALVSYVATLPHLSPGEDAHRRPLYAGKELESGGRKFNSGAAGILLSTRCAVISTSMNES